MMQTIDIGANLTSQSLLKSIGSVLKRATSVGVEHIVVTASSVADSSHAIELCARHSELLSCTAGVHPHHADTWDETSVTAITRLCAQSCVRAIGETGLDFNRNYSPSKLQIEACHRQLELASQVGLPVFAHQRDAHDTFLGILREHRAGLPGIVVHCFTDNRSALMDYLDLDCHIGITGWICDERRGLELQQLVRLIPPDRLMIETDAPYLLPRDITPKPASRINEPMYLPHILQAVAACQNKPLDLLASECYRTSRLFFGL